jgi:hypothetical protein
VQAGAAVTQQGDAAAVRAHAAVVNAALGALSGFVEWAPLGRLHSSQVIGACAFFLKAPDFQAAALAVLKQVRLALCYFVCASYAAEVVIKRMRGASTCRENLLNAKY